MDPVGCRCLIDARRSARVGHRVAPVCRRRSRRLQLGLAVALAIPALALSTSLPPGGALAAPVAAPDSSPVTMSSCTLGTALCEVEVDSSALPPQSSVSLTDGPVSIAPTRIIGVALVAHHTARGRTVKPVMLHAYFRLPRRHRAHWRLMVEARHRPRRSFALPATRTAAGAL